MSIFYSIGKHPALKNMSNKEKKLFLKNNFQKLGYGHFVWVTLMSIICGPWASKYIVGTSSDQTLIAVLTYSLVVVFWFLGYVLVLNTIVRIKINRLLKN